MNAWSVRYYIVLYFLILFHQVMCEPYMPKLLVRVKRIDLTENHDNSSKHFYNNGNGCTGTCVGSGVSVKQWERERRSLKGKVPQIVKDNLGGQESDSLRVFKYIHYDKFNPSSSTEHAISKTITTPSPPTTTFDRSLIPNSFFAPGENPSQLNNKTSNVSGKNESIFSNKSNSVRTKTIVTGDRDVKIAQVHSSPSVSERPRRSPYRHPARAALHRAPPRPVLVPIPQPQPPAPVPVPLPYTQNTATMDFGNYPQYGSGYESIVPAPHQQESINHPRYNKQPPPGNRRMPPPPRGRRPPPRPRHRPPPPPRPGGRPSGGGNPGRRLPRPSKPQYSYPKNAANIQDILNYFNENDNQIENHDPLLRPPAPPSGDLRQVSLGGGSDFSKELQDVQTSLLKDIKEFAKRPSLLGSESPSPSSRPASFENAGSHHSKQRYKPDDSEYDFFHEEKPKPVRDLAKYNEKTRDRESEELSSGSHGRKKIRDKYNDKGKGSSSHSYPPHRDESEERYQSYYNNQKKESEEKQSYKDRDRDRDRDHERDRNRDKDRERERERERDSEERDRRERERIRNRQKYSSTSSRVNYKELENSDEDREKNHDRYNRDRNRSPSQSSPVKRPHPVVLKRPYGPFRPEEYESGESYRKRPPSDSYYDDDSRRHRDPYANVPRVKPPSITYRPKNSYLSERDSPDSRLHGNANASPEYAEDVVEIHTDSPYRVDLRTREEKEKRAHLQKLYLEYLERKMEAEAALTSTTLPIKKHPMRMKIHIYPNENLASATEQAKVNYPAVSGYSHHQPIISAPSRDMTQMYTNFKNQQNVPINHHPQMPQHVQPTVNTGFGTTNTGPQMMVDKNKNVVLHLHVHRRNGFGEMEAGSEVYTTTVKPLTYKEIYDDHQQQQQQNHQHEGEPDNKSVSMELPIRDDRIDDVLHTLLKLRQS